MKEDFTDPSKKIDKLIREKEQVEGKRLKSVESQRIYDNIKFADKVEHDPIVSKEFDKKVFNFETVSLNHYINQRIWPRSIYTTDKLVRLAMSAKLEFLKRYLSKKRHVSMNMIWILLAMFGIAIVVLIVIFLLPRLDAVI